MPTDDDDKRVKDILGENNLADLQRWFGLPTYTELAEEGKTAAIPAEAVDPYKEVRERRDKALAAVEPWFLAGIHERHAKPWSLIKFKAVIDVKVRLGMELFDESMATSRATAEPREVKRSEQIEDDLRDRTPQALLRDLHRAVRYYEKEFHIYDSEAGKAFATPSDEVAKMMTTDLRLPPLPDLPGVDLRNMMAASVSELAQPWKELPKRNRMVNRRIKE